MIWIDPAIECPNPTVTMTASSPLRGALLGLVEPALGVFAPGQVFERDDNAYFGFFELSYDY